MTPETLSGQTTTPLGGRQLDQPTVIFLVNVDWFFLSHFVFIAQRLIGMGRRVIVLTEDSGRFSDLSALGVQAVALPSSRTQVGAGGALKTIQVVRRVLKTNPGAVLHGFGAFGIVMGASARVGLPGPTVFTVTGRGYIAAAQTLKSRLAANGLATFYRRIADRPSTRWVVENLDDAIALGLDSAISQGRVVKVGGAGVDLQRFPLSAMPQRPPLRIVTVARLIWSKGIDTAAMAVIAARRQNINVTLTVVGETDAGNPRSLSAEDRARFTAAEGVTFLGFSPDVPAILAQHHVGLLASRGGEGVPKSLIEMAAAGRPIITTDVPGCRAFAVDTGGWIVPPDNVSALVEAIATVANIHDLTEHGHRARRAVEIGYTQEAVWQSITDLYDIER